MVPVAAAGVAEEPGAVRAAHAEGADADERAAGQRDLGRRGGIGPADPAGDPGGGAGRARPGFPDEQPDPGERGGDRQKPPGQLADRAPVRAEAGGGGVRLHRNADRQGERGDRQPTAQAPSP